MEWFTIFEVGLEPMGAFPLGTDNKVIDIDGGSKHRDQRNPHPIVRILLIGLTYLLPAVLLAQNLVKVGPEFRVNSYTTGFQSSPKVTTGSRDQFIVTWGSEGSFGSDLGVSIQAQRFDRFGSRVGSEFQVNSYTTSWQLWPAVAINDVNDFLIVWSSIGSYGTDSDWFSIQGQRFNGAGTPVGGQFQVSTYTTDWQLLPEVVADGEGDFVVVWDSGGSAFTDTDSYSVQGQRLNAQAGMVGPEFQVNSYTTRRQYYPSVAAGATGRFIVVWESQGSTGNDQFAASVQGQRYFASGARNGSEFQINTYTRGDQRGPSIAMADSGDFMVVWSSNSERENVTQGYEVRAQSFAADGTRIGAEFQVNDTTTVSNRWAVVTAEPSGNFVVAWGQYDYNASVRRGDIYARRVSRNGGVLGNQIRVSTAIDGYKSVPSIASQHDGFVVVWRTEYLGSRSDIDVKGQRLSLSAAGSGLFADGFESGSTAAWD